MTFGRIRKIWRIKIFECLVLYQSFPQKILRVLRYSHTWFRRYTHISSGCYNHPSCMRILLRLENLFFNIKTDNSSKLLTKDRRADGKKNRCLLREYRSKLYHKHYLAVSNAYFFLISSNFEFLPKFFKPWIIEYAFTHVLFVCIFACKF